MNVITHLLVGWAIAEHAPLPDRDRACLAWASVGPDIDGVGLVVDVGNRVLGRPESTYFAEWHHVLLHGLPGAVAITAVAAALGRSRLKLALATFAIVHLHLFCDFVGARGPGPDDVWPIYYLAPISLTPELAWSGQWELNSWINITLTLALMALAFRRAVVHGRSPVSLFSRRANEAFVETVRRRWAMVRRCVHHE